MTAVESGGAGGSGNADGIGGDVEKLGFAGCAVAAAGSRRLLQLKKAVVGAARAAAAARPSPETDVATAVAAVRTPETQGLGHDMGRVEGRGCSKWRMWARGRIVESSSFTTCSRIGKIGWQIPLMSRGGAPLSSVSTAMFACFAVTLRVQRRPVG